MTKYLDRDFQNMYRRLLSVFGVVEKMIDDAATALIAKRVELSNDVLQNDKFVNDTEVEIEEECLKMLALHHPVAGDMRRLTTVLKINVELERMADLACNIAERAVSLHEHPGFPIPIQLTEMVRQATKMVRMALDSFVESDADLAKQVIVFDEIVDEFNELIIEELKSMMITEPKLVDPALHCFSATRHIERIADLAENIAEDVIYLVDGDIVRHKHGNFTTQNQRLSNG